MKSLKKRVENLERARGIEGQRVQPVDHARGDGFERNEKVSAGVETFLNALRLSLKNHPEGGMEYSTGPDSVT